MRRALALVVLAALVACHASPPAPSADGGGAGCGIDAGCGEGRYCAYQPRLCGKGKRPGACRDAPARCDDAFQPACGCDGQVYANECRAAAAGVDLSVNGGCAAKVPGFIPCGAHFCDARTSYCEIVLSDVFELPTDRTCKPLPEACLPDGGTARRCECFPAGTRCQSFCGHVETGGLAGFHLTCRL
jgi:hypothetical protein